MLGLETVLILLLLLLLLLGMLLGMLQRILLGQLGLSVLLFEVERALGVSAAIIDQSSADVDCFVIVADVGIG